MSAVVSAGGIASVVVHQSRIRQGRIRLGISEVLDEAYQLISSGRVAEGMGFLADRLLQWRASIDSHEWESFCQGEVLSHPLGLLIWQDPFTAHSFRKPRGYSGDAQLLDYIYGDSPMPSDTTPMGAAIFRYSTNRQAPRSVRARAQILSRLIDETADQFTAPKVLSIACGHLREAGRSQAVIGGRIAQFIALDQDADSLAQVDRAYANVGVRTVNSSVRALLAGKLHLEGFHLVYAAGLYDYLSDRVAARLTQMMFDMLAPGGRLLVANFAPCLTDIGYMETYMGWKLIYRGPDEMTAIGREVPSDRWKSHRLFWDEHESIIFLELTKRSGASASIKPNGKSNGFVVPGLKNVTISPRVSSRPARTNGHPPASASD